MKDYKALILTIIQYSTLVIMMWRMPWFNSSSIILLIIEFIGFSVAAFALYEMNKSKINISPIPRKGAFLVRTGIYSEIRHPMYSSLLLIFIPILISNYSVINTVIFIIFFINIILKLSYEEKLLEVFFIDYSIYASKTKRIIPFIY